MTGKFITLEGPEGSGKTTVSKELVKILNESGYKVLLTTLFILQSRENQVG